MNSLETVFGIHAVAALLDYHPRRIKSIAVQQGRNDQRIQQLLEKAAPFRIEVKTLSKDELDALCLADHQGSLQGVVHQGIVHQGAVHQGIVAWCNPSQTVARQELFQLLDKLEKPALLLILDNVTDPHNLGACLRTAEAAGADAVIIPKHKSATLSPTVRKIACGAAEIIPLVVVPNLAQLLNELKERGIWIAGTAGEASQPLYQCDLTAPLALVMGAEGQGLRRLTRETCDYLLHIPMAGSTESLNVSVASGICLFEALRQRLASDIQKINP